MHNANGPVEMQPAPCRHAGIAVTIAALLLVLFAGCAPVPVPQKLGPDAGSAVTEPEETRRGFTIEEPAGTDAETRSAFDRAVDFMDRARYDEAIVLLEQVIDRAPGLTAPHINIALAYDQKEDSEKAEEHLKAALELIPGHPVASNIYGLLLRKSGRFAESREIFETALNLFPEYLPARKNFGILCELYLNDPATALEQYEIYSEAVPDDEAVTTWIASLQQRLGGTQ